MFKIPAFLKRLSINKRLLGVALRYPKSFFSFLVLAYFVFSLLLSIVVQILPPTKYFDNPSFPYIEKISEGVSELKNYETIKQTIASPKADLNLKVNNNGSFKWKVTLLSGTNFLFGKQTKEGMLPNVRVVSAEGYFVEYSPRDFKGFISPRVSGNIVEWEIEEGLVARYTMQQDRVKADYIVDSQWSMVNGQKEKWNGKLYFDVLSGRESQSKNQEDQSSAINNQPSLSGDLMPNGDIEWITNEEGSTNIIFTFPIPEIIDAEKDKFEGSYSLTRQKTGQSLLSIILPKEKVENAQFPLTVDPVTVDSASVLTATAYGNGRKLLRDAYGNLIAVIASGSNDSVFYKSHSALSWTNAAIDLALDQSYIASDIDSSGNVHSVFKEFTFGNTVYVKLTVTRNSNNEITGISEGTNLTISEASGLAWRPSVIIANKGGGSGVEKIAIAYAVNTTGATPRGEVRFMQCDVADTCTTAANWKNASEEINGNGTCSDTATSGDAGLPDTTANAGCKGTTDKLFSQTTSNTKHHVVLTQMSGRPKRSPTKVFKYQSSTYTDLSNTYDNNPATTGDISSLSTTDYLYIGDNLVFSNADIDIVNDNATANNGADTMTAEYCSAVDGSNNCTTWSSLSNVINYTSDYFSGDFSWNDFGHDGSLLFDEPSNWISSTVNSVNKYWVRFSPGGGSIDASVTIGEIYITDRNSQALLVVVGVDSSDDLSTAYVPWDFVNNAGWQKKKQIALIHWKSDSGGTSSAVHNTGGNWTAYTNFPLTATVDYENNRAYVAFVADYGTLGVTSDDALTVRSLANNKDPTVYANWDSSAFPAVTEALDAVLSLTSDGPDLYLFYVLDPGTNALVYSKCALCSSGGSWGSGVTLDSATDRRHPQAVVSKMPGDTVAIDLIYTQDTTTDTVQYERHFVDNQDKTVVVAASGDDAYHRDCVSGTDDQDIASTTVKLGREAADASCSGSVDSENHVGLRFPNITVSQGAVVSSAYIDLRVSARTGSGAIDFSVYGEDVDNAVNAGAVWSELTNCTDPCTDAVNTVTKTTSNSSQSIDLVTNTYRIDVTNIVQEIVCRGAANSQPCVGNFNGSGTWASGNALAILMISTEGGGDNSVTIVAQDSTSGNLEPTLQINLAETTSGTSSWASIGGGANASGDVNGNWDSRKKVTFNNIRSSENLANFPVLVRLDSSNIDYAKTKSSGEDLRFVDSDGSTLLKYDIEKWNESGESLVWVKVPQIDSSSAKDYIWIYYNNSNGDAGQDAANVWSTSNNYQGVWHLKDATTSTVSDSTSNGNTGTKTAANEPIEVTTGKIGNAQEFDASNDSVNAGDPASLQITGQITVEAWVKLKTTGTYQIISKDKNTGGRAYTFDILNSGSGCWGGTNTQFCARFYLNGGGSPTSNEIDSRASLVANRWYHVAGTYVPSGEMHIYINGVRDDQNTVTTAVSAINSATANVRIGSREYAGAEEYINGFIDEARISNTARSADWIEATYHATNPESNFATLSPEQGPTAESTTVTSSYSKGVHYPHTGATDLTNLDHPFSSEEYVSVQADDSNYVEVSAEMNPTASTSAVPMFIYKVNNLNNSNTYKIDATAKFKSSIPTSSKTVHMQIYRGGSTDNWIDVDTDTATAGDTEFALDMTEISTNLSEYYFNETPGIGTQYAECTTSTANCWVYFRIWQEPQGTSGTNQILYSDYFNVTFSPSGPDKIAFSNSPRTLTANACNGAASVFTMELQSGTTPTNPLSTTVVRVTSNSTDYTIYSDSTCSTVESPADFTYTTSQNTKSVYIIDNKKSISTRTLTGTRQSGDTLTTGTQDYTVNAGSVTRLVITLPGQTFTDSVGNSGTVLNQASGAPFNMQINATDSYFNLNTSYTGDKTLVFSGPGVGGSTPTVRDKNSVDQNYGTNTIITFSSGNAANVSTTLYKGETTTITATDGGSYGYASASLTINVPRSSIRGGTIIRGGTRF